MGRLCTSCLENIIMSGVLTVAVIFMRMLIFKKR